MITVIGLGTQSGELTLRARNALKRADKILVRNRCPACEALEEEGLCFETLDGVYEKSRSFQTLTQNLYREIVRQANGISLCYCVEGGVSEDRAAQLLLQKQKDVAVIEGVSKCAAVAAEAGFFSYLALSAYEAGERELTLPLIVYDLVNQETASDVKLVLSERFGDEARALLFANGKKKEIALYELDRQKEYNSTCALALPDLPLLEKKRFGLYDFIAILKRLRAPDGCPWDRVQTHESIRINLIEEAYELVDAIDLDDAEKMEEEAGDVLMQSLFHTLIEEERGRFNVTDMLSHVCEKLISRHTHVFGQDKAAGADGALSVWEKNKMTEKHQVTFSDAVNDVPECFPALLRAQKIAKRVAKGGWEIGDFNAIEEKIKEELAELKEAFQQGEKARIEEELGDMLMAAAELSRCVGADAEQALLDSVKKIQKRFTRYEELVLADGKEVNALSQQEKDEYYQKAKNAT